MQFSRFAIAAALVAATALPLSALACNKNFTVYNRSSSLTVTRFYASPSNGDDWEENILGKDTIEPGHKTEIDMSDDKRADKNYDVLAVLSDGTKIKRSNIDLCAITGITVYDDRIKYIMPVEY